MRIVFMGTPDFAVPCLEMLVKEGYEIVGVVSQPDRPKGRGQKLQPSPVKECALAHNLPIFQPEKVKDPSFQEMLKQLAPEAMVVVAFGQILPESVLCIPPLGSINVHASLLPAYRGSAPIHWAILNGETETGITTMFMDKGMDTGDMILKKTVSIGLHMTTGELHDQLAALGANILRDTMTLLRKNQAPRIKQEHATATYAPQLRREHERIDWCKSAIQVHNLIRGMNPFPGAYSHCQDRILKIWCSKVLTSEVHTYIPGTIIDVNQEGMAVACGEGIIMILQVQPQNGKKIAASDFIRGYRLERGDILGTAAKE